MTSSNVLPPVNQYTLHCTAQAHVDRRLYISTLQAISPRLVNLAKQLDPESLAKVLWALGRAGGGGSVAAHDELSEPGGDTAADTQGLGTAVRALSACLPTSAPLMTAQSCAMAAWGLASLEYQDQV